MFTFNQIVCFNLQHSAAVNKMNFFWILTGLSLIVVVKTSVIEFEAIFYDVLPSNYGIYSKNSNSFEIEAVSPKKLIAGRFNSITEAVAELFGAEIEQVLKFDLNKNHDLKIEDIETAQNQTIEDLAHDLTVGAYSELTIIYFKFRSIYQILKEISIGELLLVYHELFQSMKPEALFSMIEDSTDMEHLEGEEDLELLKMLNIESLNEDVYYYAEIPLVDVEDNQRINYFNELFVTVQEDENGEEENEEVDFNFEASGLKTLLSIPVYIVKFILKIIWILSKLKKYIKLTETKICLLIIEMIENICKVIYKIKKTIKDIFNKIFNEIAIELIHKNIAKTVLKKIKVIMILIIRRLRILSWELNDILYRYKWKLIFLLKKSEKKSLLISLIFKEFVFKNLDKKIIDQRDKNNGNYIDFIDYNSDIYSKWDDLVYFKKFTKFYNDPTAGINKEDDEELKRVFETIQEDPDYYDKLFNEDEEKEDEADDKGNECFDLNEEFGFDSVHINYGKEFNLNSRKDKPIKFII